MILNTLLALSLGAMLISCGTKNVADDYIKNGGGQPAAADATPGDETGDTTGDETGTDPEAGEPDGSGTGDETAQGDAEKGKIFLQNCAACHVAGGLAKNVTLDASAIPRLDTAFTGVQSAIHAVNAEAFQQPGRADLEAALKAIP